MVVDLGQRYCWCSTAPKGEQGRAELGAKYVKQNKSLWLTLMEMCVLLFGGRLGKQSNNIAPVNGHSAKKEES